MSAVSSATVCREWSSTREAICFSALPSNLDIERRDRHVSNVPLGNIKSFAAAAQEIVSQPSL
jgi:hypothetical protein